VIDQIDKRGSLSFSEYQNLALYSSQGGFYARRGSAGRKGDFITSPEVGNLFGRVMASALDRYWRGLGSPDPFHAIEGGAGVGTLAASIFDAEPECISALRYVAVERSASLRTEHIGTLPVNTPERVLSLDPEVIRRGPAVASMADLPEGKFTGVVIANELLDNLAVDIYEWRAGRWHEVRVGLSKHGDLIEVFRSLPEDEPVVEWLRELGDSPAPHARLALQSAACDWLARALGLIDSGHVVVIDYVRTSGWMLAHPWGEWLRTYRGQRVGTSPLESPGAQDITCELALDQLAAVRTPDRNRSQTDFLEANGLAELVSEAREHWHSSADVADLASMKARSRVNEGRALTDPSGLGRFRVLEWDVPPRPARKNAPAT